MSGEFTVVVVDLLCNSPFYSGAFTSALNKTDATAELASPRFHLEPDALDSYPRARWIMDLVVHGRRPRPLRLALRAIELTVNLTRLLVRITRRRYDVVHVQWVPLELRTTVFMRLLRVACDRSGTLLVVTAHNAMPHDTPNADPAPLRRNLSQAHLVIALADHVATELADHVGIRVPIATVPHGPMFTDRPLPPRQAAVARLGLGEGPIVLFLGLIRAYKGIDILSSAWPVVLAAFPTATLLVVGKVLDPIAQVSLEGLRVQRNTRIIDEYVPVQKMLDCYAAADVVAFPYHRISQSGGLMTAAGLGRPVVVTPVDGLLEQARALTSAIQADDLSGVAFGRAVISSLSDRPRQQAAASRDRVAIADSAIGWPAVARATLRAYDGASADPRQRTK